MTSHHEKKSNLVQPVAATNALTRLGVKMAAHRTKNLSNYLADVPKSPTPLLRGKHSELGEACDGPSYTAIS